MTRKSGTLAPAFRLRRLSDAMAQTLRPAHPMVTHKAKSYLNRGFFPLLELPGEVRNLVFKHAIGKARILVLKSQPEKLAAEQKQLWVNEGMTVRQRRVRLYCQLDQHQLKKGLELPGSLMRVCKQVKAEAEFFLYSETTFCFMSTKVIARFLGSASAQGLRHIQCVELSFAGHGKVRAVADRIWKRKHDQAWERSCAQLAARLPALDDLTVEYQICEGSAQLKSRGHWQKSILCFTRRRKFGHVSIRLHHHNASAAALDQIATKLENRMMSEEGIARRRQETLEAEIARITAIELSEKQDKVHEPPVRAQQCLVVAISEEQRKAQKQKTDIQHDLTATAWEWKHGKGNTLEGTLPYCSWDEASGRYVTKWKKDVPVKDMTWT